MRAHWLLVVVMVVEAGVGAGCGGGGGSSSLTPDAGPTHIDRAHLAGLGASGRLDYADPALWLCRPDIDPDACAADLDATEFLADGTRRPAPHVRAARPAFDCFYVYPTVYFGEGNMTDLSDVSATLDPLLSQAARFSRICTVYAPLYRQSGLSVTAGGLGGDLDLALQDARDAFAYYLAHLNGGRKFVLLGHSQGTFMLKQVIARDIEGQPDVLGRMISAVLIGGEVKVATGAGDPPPVCSEALGAGDCVSFHALPLCRTPADTRCVVAYSSYRAEAPPQAASAGFGRGTARVKVACVNPRSAPGPYRGSYLPVHFVNPLFAPSNAVLPGDITTPFVMARDVFDGACVERTVDGVPFSYLEISLHHVAGDQRPALPYWSGVQETLGFGLHVADYNLVEDDLIDWVEQQAAALPR